MGAVPPGWSAGPWIGPEEHAVGAGAGVSTASAGLATYTLIQLTSGDPCASQDALDCCFEHARQSSGNQQTFWSGTCEAIGGTDAGALDFSPGLYGDNSVYDPEDLFAGILRVSVSVGAVRLDGSALLRHSSYEALAAPAPDGQLTDWESTDDAEVVSSSAHVGTSPNGLGCGVNLRVTADYTGHLSGGLMTLGALAGMGVAASGSTGDAFDVDGGGLAAFDVVLSSQEVEGDVGPTLQAYPFEGSSFRSGQTTGDALAMTIRIPRYRYLRPGRPPLRRRQNARGGLALPPLRQNASGGQLFPPLRRRQDGAR